MLKVGVTGGIGSGKSIVCEVFKTLSVPVFDADTEAKKLLETKEVQDFYRNIFGNQVFTNNELDKNKIAQLIFNDSSALKLINEFIHPLVYQQFDTWCLEHSHFKYIIKEAALTFETGAYKTLDYNILVCAPEEIRIQRVMKRSQLTRDQVIQRIRNQWPDERKREHAQLVIENDGTNPILEQIINTHTFLLNQ